MKVLLALMVFLLAGTAQAEEPKFSVDVRLVTEMHVCAATVPDCGDAAPKTAEVPVNCIEEASGEICHHFYEKSRLAITYTPRGKTQDCLPLHANLEQVSSRLLMPLPGLLELKGTTDCEPALLNVELPAIAHETELRLSFSARKAGDAGGGDDFFYAVPVKVYPRTLMDTMKSWAAFEGNALIVQDKEGRLLDFLDKSKVKYLTRDTMPGAERKLHIVVGNPPEREERDEITGDVMYLMERTDILPVVRIRETPKRMTVKVKTKLLGALAADDPLATKAFVEIFKEIAK